MAGTVVAIVAPQGQTVNAVQSAHAAPMAKVSFITQKLDRDMPHTLDAVFRRLGLGARAEAQPRGRDRAPREAERAGGLEHRAVRGSHRSPRVRISRFSAAAISGTVSTRVPSRSSRSVRATMLHSETRIEPIA